MREELEKLAQEWHEAGRADFAKETPNLHYDSYLPHTVKEKTKFFYLDEGSSGVFMVRKEDCAIFRIKGYGVPNLRKFVGFLKDVTGARLQACRW